MAALKVEDLMTAEVFTVAPGDSVEKVYDMMDSHHIRHVPVVDEAGNLAGLVTHRDLVRGVMLDESLPLSSQRDYLKAVLVQEIMTREVETVGPDLDLREAGQTMLDNKFGCLPVTDDSKLVGILTEADFVRQVVEDLS